MYENPPLFFFNQSNSDGILKYIYNEDHVEWELYDNHFRNEEDEWLYGYEEIQVGYTEDISRERHLIYELEYYKFKYRYRKMPEFLRIQ